MIKGIRREVGVAFRTVNWSVELVGLVGCSTAIDVDAPSERTALLSNGCKG